MKLITFAAALFSVAALSSSAFAQCEVKGSTFIWGSDTDVTMYLNKGETCGVGLVMRGSMVDSITVISPAKNGAVGAAGLTAFGYRPKPGFVGADAFKVRAIGSNNSSKGPIIFNVTVVVK